MRPDEHKKKKNAQYKKKHGFSSEKSKKDVSEGHSTAQTKNKVAVSPLKSEDENSTKKVAGEEIAESVTGFGRRQIESNWGKYEGLDQVDEDIGTDYNVLLSFAGGAHSYKHAEKEVGSEIDFSELSIDCNHLADSLEHLSFSDKYMLQDLNIDPVILGYINTMVLDQEIDAAEEVQGHAVLSSSLAKDLGFDFTKPIKSENTLWTEGTKVDEIKDSSVTEVPQTKPTISNDIIRSKVQRSRTPESLMDATSSFRIPINKSKDIAAQKSTNVGSSSNDEAEDSSGSTHNSITVDKRNTCTDDHETDGPDLFTGVSPKQDLDSGRTNDLVVMKKFEFKTAKQEQESGLEEELDNLLLASVKQSSAETDLHSKDKPAKTDETEEAEQDLEEWLDSIL